MLGEGLLYQVERNRQRMRKSMERRITALYILAIVIGWAAVIWNLCR